MNRIFDEYKTSRGKLLVALNVPDIEHFDYDIEDRRESYWELLFGDSEVVWAPNMEEFRAADNLFYQAEVAYKCIGRGAELTLVVVDNDNGGSPFALVFDNAKEIQE